MPTKRRRVMVNLPPDLEGPAIARARLENRSLANYIECLIMRDIGVSPDLAQKISIAQAQAAIPPKLWKKIQAAKAEAALPPLHVIPTPPPRVSNPSRRPNPK